MRHYGSSRETSAGTAAEQVPGAREKQKGNPKETRKAERGEPRGFQTEGEADLGETPQEDRRVKELTSAVRGATWDHRVL